MGLHLLLRLRSIPFLGRGNGRRIRGGCGLRLGILRLKVADISKDLLVNSGLQEPNLDKHLPDILGIGNLVFVSVNLILGHKFVVDKDLRHVLVSHKKSLRLNHQLATPRNTHT